MFHLLIADDEPLVLAGIQSLLNWEDYDVDIIGTAPNGMAAYQMIQEFHPEIVITDIKMPAMSGLELARKCREERKDLPVFIILSSYEEFQYAKEALNYQVTDYLIKLELTPEVLSLALHTAIAKVKSITTSLAPAGSSAGSLYLLKEQFHTRLLLNLFESEQQLSEQAKNLNLDLSYPAYAAGIMEIRSESFTSMESSHKLTLYANSLQIIKELLVKYVPCYVLSLDTRHFSVIFFLTEEDARDYRQTIRHAVSHVSSMLFNYYNVNLCIGIGPMVLHPAQISSSYANAKQTLPLATSEAPVIFTEDNQKIHPLRTVFNMSLFTDDIQKAFLVQDEKAIYDILTSILELFESHPNHHLMALDAAGNILHLTLFSLNNGEQLVTEIFRDKLNGYRSLYELTCTSQVLDWLRTLRDGLCAAFCEYNNHLKHHMVVTAKKYINEHIQEKLTLNQIAGICGISPNYLSILCLLYTSPSPRDS